MAEPSVLVTVRLATGEAVSVSVALVVLPPVPSGGVAKTVLTRGPVRLASGRMVNVKDVDPVGMRVPVVSFTELEPES